MDARCILESLAAAAAATATAAVGVILAVGNGSDCCRVEAETVSRGWPSIATAIRIVGR